MKDNLDISIKITQGHRMSNLLEPLSEKELSGIFAREVLGWAHSKAEAEHGELWEMWHENGLLVSAPLFAESADAILPFLYKEHWEVSQTGYPNALIGVKVNDRSYVESNSFPKAACIALIRENRLMSYMH